MKVKVQFYCFGYFVYWHINLCWVFNAKAILEEEQQWYYLTNSYGRIRGFIPFPRVLVWKWTYQHDWSLNLLTLRPQSTTLAMTPFTIADPPIVFILLFIMFLLFLIYNIAIHFFSNNPWYIFLSYYQLSKWRVPMT